MSILDTFLSDFKNGLEEKLPSVHGCLFSNNTDEGSLFDDEAETDLDILLTSDIDEVNEESEINLEEFLGSLDEEDNVDEDSGQSVNEDNLTSVFSISESAVDDFLKSLDA